jgi:hypothetical protein
LYTATSIALTFGSGAVAQRSFVSGRLTLGLEILETTRNIHTKKFIKKRHAKSSEKTDELHITTESELPNVYTLSQWFQR